MKARALKKGDRVAVIAPAGPVDAEKLERGCDALRRHGYEIALGSAVLARDGYFAGPAERRACDLNRMLRDDSIAAILTARGGYGSNYLLSRVELGELRRSPKLFGGYSDLTSLMTYMLDRTGVPNIQAPLVTADWARADGVDLESWEAVVGGRRHAYRIPETLREGTAEGVLYGGCLSLLSAAVGTPYEPRTEGTLLFLEDCHEAPYRIDRMLRQLELAGKLRNVSGMVFGTMEGCCGDTGLIAQELQRVLRWFEGPIAFGLPSGHAGQPHQTLAFGVPVRLKAGASGAELQMLETAVE